MTITDIVVPALGESVAEATVARWLKKPGDLLALDEPVAELETDKITLEVNAAAAGTLAEISANEGDSVEVGALLGRIESRASTIELSSSVLPQEKEQPEIISPHESEKLSLPASPSARKLMKENRLTAVEGSGRRGHVTKADVLAAVSLSTEKSLQKPSVSVPSEVPPMPAGSVGLREERVPMTKLRRVIAKRLKDAQNTAAMLTTFNEVDMTNLILLRSRYREIFEKKHGIRLGFLSFFVKAVILALKEIPAVNAEIRDQDVVYKNYYNIGVAVGTPQGLVVPVLRDADEAGFADIESRIAQLAKQAREGKLALDDLMGGSFTITNGGVYGSLLSTPILNPPQSGILGMHKIMKRPVVLEDNTMVARDMMYLALSYDHRIVDGREAVTFLVRVKQSIEDPERLLLAI